MLESKMVHRKKKNTAKVIILKMRAVDHSMLQHRAIRYGIYVNVHLKIKLNLKMDEKKEYDKDAVIPHQTNTITPWIGSVLMLSANA